MPRMTKEARLREITGTPQAEREGFTVGRTYICDVCGTRVREGQSHRTDVFPAHATLGALIVEEKLPEPDGQAVLWVSA